MLNPTRIFLSFIAVVACFLLTATHPASAEEANRLRIVDHKQPDDYTQTYLIGDRPVFRYRFSEVPFKPYIDQLFSPSGVQVLRDSPADHKHHHALMFALAVDGVNFWEEYSPKAGKERHRSWGESGSRALTGPGHGDKFYRKSNSEWLDWIGPDSDRPMMVENRQFTLYQADLGATLIEWRSRLETPPGKKSITLTGHHYFGLGMRFVESMDRGGKFFNSDGRQGEVVRGDERLTPAKWCAYTAKADGHQVTVAIFDHPNNLRHPAKMFTMTKPFAYMSATLNEWKEPVEVKAGQPLNLRYGVALWDGEVDKATVEKLYQRWLKLGEDIVKSTH